MRFVEALREYDTARFGLYANLSDCIDIIRRLGDPEQLPGFVKNLTMGDAAERLIQTGDMQKILKILDAADRLCDEM